MKRTICLNMIVKDESKVIERCLASVKNIIDYWVIVDTGSMDGTQEIIQEFLKDVPGELHESPWVDFAFNRNEALFLAKKKADYLLLIDADQFVVFEDCFTLPNLKADVYSCHIFSDFTHLHHEILVATHLDFLWEGVIHEGIRYLGNKSIEFLDQIKIMATQEGNRSLTGNKFLQDAAILKKEVEKDPTNSRNIFYLAVSLANAKELSQALPYFEKRVSMGGKADEIYCSLFTIGAIQQELNRPPEIFINSLARAFLFRPTRAEPLYAIAKYYLSIQNYFHSYLITKFALTIPCPKNELFVHNWVYQYELLLVLAECAYYLGFIDESITSYQKVIDLFEGYLAERQFSQSYLQEIKEKLSSIKKVQAEISIHRAKR